MKKNDTSKIIELKNVNKYFGVKPAVNNVSFSIKKGEFVTLLGPSGCGKTTTLRMIAGFEKPTDGQILFNGEDITTVPPHRRNLNTVFQKYALFPHLNVFGNVAFGLKNKLVENGTKEKGGNTYQLYRKLTKEEIKQKVEKALKMVDLEDYGYRSVDSLSGGQQQRVAIARALVNEPEVLLLDEPLGALDLKMRKDMQLELKAMHKNLGITFVYVTHDQEEALTMSDRIIIMKNGVIQQIGTAKQVYDEPANAFVADFRILSWPWQWLPAVYLPSDFSGNSEKNRSLRCSAKIKLQSNKKQAPKDNYAYKKKHNCKLSTSKFFHIKHLFKSILSRQSIRLNAKTC